MPPEKPAAYDWYGLEVTVSAYNSVRWQTLGNPNVAAWGDTLDPQVKSIAVSRDLLQLGLIKDTPVLLEAFADTFLVKDKMNRRWRKRIDIFMGKDVKKAREWGVKKMMICYGIRRDSLKPIQ